MSGVFSEIPKEVEAAATTFLDKRDFGGLFDRVEWNPDRKILTIFHGAQKTEVLVLFTSSGHQIVALRHVNQPNRDFHPNDLL